MWIDSLEELEKHVVVSNDLNFESITAREAEVIDQYLVDWFGETLMDELLGYKEEPVNSNHYKAFFRMQKAIAKLMLRNHIPAIEIQVGDGGLTRIDNENVKSAYLQQVNRLILTLEEESYVQQEKLQDFLYANQNDFPGWSIAPGYTYNELIFIRSATEFDRITRLYRKYQTYHAIYPCVSSVQALFLESRYPSGVISTLLPGTGLNTFKLKLRETLQNALVFLTMKEAIFDGLVKVSGDGVRLIMADSDTGAQLEEKAPTDALSAQIRNYEKKGMSFLALADKMIRDNPSEFGLTATTPVEKTRFIA